MTNASSESDHHGFKETKVSTFPILSMWQAADSGSKWYA